MPILVRWLSTIFFQDLYRVYKSTKLGINVVLGMLTILRPVPTQTSSGNGVLGGEKMQKIFNWASCMWYKKLKSCFSGEKKLNIFLKTYGACL